MRALCRQFCALLRLCLPWAKNGSRYDTWWALKDLNLRPFGCKPNALTAELSALLHLSYSMPRAASTHRQMPSGICVCGPAPLFLHFVSAASKLYFIHFARDEARMLLNRDYVGYMATEVVKQLVDGGLIETKAAEAVA